MKETFGEDIFDKINIADAICITTNCSIFKEYGAMINPMGALAGAAAKKWCNIPYIYGKLLNIIGAVPVVLGYIDKENHSDLLSVYDTSSSHYNLEFYTALVAYPTMYEIGIPADLELVKRSAFLLNEMANMQNWKTIYTGSPGTGVGRFEL